MAVFLLLLIVVMLLVAVVGLLIVISWSRGGLGYPACGACQYDLSGSIGSVERCPECGALFTMVGITRPGRPKKGLMLWVGVGLMLIPLVLGAFIVLSAMLAVRTQMRMPPPTTAPAPAQQPQDAAPPADSI